MFCPKTSLGISLGMKAHISYHNVCLISYRSIETVRGYKPPLDVEERLQALTEQVYNDELDDHGDWKTQPLHDRFKKYKVQFSG